MEDSIMIQTLSLSSGVSFEGFIGRLAAPIRALLGDELGEDEQENLKGLLVEIQVGLNKAEKMMRRSPVHLWVSDVKDTAYELDDLFEEIQLKKVICKPGSSFGDKISMLMERLKNLREGMKSFDIGSNSRQGKDTSSFPQSIRNRIIIPRDNNHSIAQGCIAGGFKELISELPIKRTASPTYDALPWYLRHCLGFCTLYPNDLSFKKDLLVLLWMAEGFVQPVGGKRLEDVGAHYFDALLSWSFFQVSYPGNKWQVPTYKLREGCEDTLRGYASRYNEFVRIKFSDEAVSEKTRHASGIYHTTLHAFSGLIGLHSLLLLSKNPNRGTDVPFDLFWKMKYLRVLVLSGAGIKEVPCPVWDMVHLRYLDLSDNEIEILPEKLGNLYSLQTLRLLGCPISMFPKNFHKLINLRHFHIYPFGCMTAFPQHIGRLTSLQTLPFFNVMKESGSRIEELMKLNDLQDELFIRDLENVASSDEAEEAKLNAKQHLSSLKLKWSSCVHNVNYDIINGLRPHKNLSVLEIVRYRGSEFPSWISDPSFTNLVSITLTGCVSCKLPPLGRLPCLESLDISEMGRVKHIGPEFYGHGAAERGFSSLRLLELQNMYDLEEWEDFTEVDFPMLQELSISMCPKLKNLPEMKFLSSLQGFSIFDCPELQWLPKKGLPNVVQSLKIMECPKLAERCQRENGADWNKIAHIPLLETDFLSFW